MDREAQDKVARILHETGRVLIGKPWENFDMLKAEERKFYFTWAGEEILPALRVLGYHK